MFGYFKFKEQYSSYSERKAYKNYYCGLCFALGCNYGNLSRMLLSYDITMITVLTTALADPLYKKFPCVGCKKNKQILFSADNWKVAAAINILLASEKLIDDIYDEKSFIATIKRLLFRRIIKKAEKEYPNTFQIIRNGYKKIVIDEKEKKSVIRIGCDFADMMLAVSETNYELSELQKLFIYEISRWLYYIDALDDYDEDIRKKRFNPLVIEGVSFKNYTEKYYAVIQKDLSDIFKNFEDLRKYFINTTLENRLINSFIVNTIPSVTAAILKRSI